MTSFFLTTAIDYVNSRPHLGTAYEKVTADVIARYKRLSGVPTHFLMGNDEHSQNVYRKARELGLEPHAYCDQMETAFREVWAKLSISFDDFIRTTEPRHRAAVQRRRESTTSRLFPVFLFLSAHSASPSPRPPRFSGPITTTKAIPVALRMLRSRQGRMSNSRAFVSPSLNWSMPGSE